MPACWFIRTAHGEEGPFSLIELRLFLDDGTIRADTLVRLESSPAWMPAHQAEESGDMPALQVEAPVGAALIPGRDVFSDRDALVVLEAQPPPSATDSDQTTPGPQGSASSTERPVVLQLQLPAVEQEKPSLADKGILVLRVISRSRYEGRTLTAGRHARLLLTDPQSLVLACVCRRQLPPPLAGLVMLATAVATVALGVRVGSYAADVVAGPRVEPWHQMVSVAVVLAGLGATWISVLATAWREYPSLRRFMEDHLQIGLLAGDWCDAEISGSLNQGWELVLRGRNAGNCIRLAVFDHQRRALVDAFRSHLPALRVVGDGFSLPAAPLEPSEIVVAEIVPAWATRLCPYCGKEILAVARKCKHCWRFLDQGTACAVPVAPVEVRVDGRSLQMVFPGAEASKVTGTVAEFFRRECYRLEEGTPGHGIYGVGNTAARFLFGPLGRRFRFAVEIEATANDVRLRVTQAMSGVVGAVIGLPAMSRETSRLFCALRWRLGG